MATTTTSLTEKRKARKLSRSEARKKRDLKLNTDPEFKKAYFAAKRTRSVSRVSAFKKGKDGKKK